jgi:TonB family protein
VDKDDQNTTDEQWQPSSAESWEEVAVEPRPALSQPGQLREPWLNYEEHETSPADLRRRRRLLGRGMAGGVILVALIASVVMLRPHRALIAEYFDDLKKLALGETSDAQQPSEDTTKQSTRRPRKVRDEPTESPGPIAVSPGGEASTQPQPPNPPQLQVQEHDNQRRVVQLRSGPVVKLRDWGAEGRIEVSGELPEKQEMPTYPAMALRDRVQGTVVLRALVGRNGRVQNVQVLSGPSLLASAAVAAVRRWRYEPSVQNGELVGAEKQITVQFTISIN